MSQPSEHPHSRISWLPGLQEIVSHTLAYGIVTGLIALPSLLLTALYWLEVKTLPIWIVTLLIAACSTVVAVATYQSLVRKFTLIRAFDHNVFARIASAGGEILILNTFIPNADHIVDELRNALARGSRIRVLLLNPNCPEVQFRAETLGKALTHIQEQIKLTICVLAESVFANAKNKELIELRLYESWAPFSMYSSDRKALVGFFLNGILAVDGPQLVISKRDRLFRIFAEQFERIWKNPNVRVLPLENWQKAIDLIR